MWGIEKIIIKNHPKATEIKNGLQKLAYHGKGDVMRLRGTLGHWCRKVDTGGDCTTGKLCTW